MGYAVRVTMMGDLFGFERLGDPATESEPSISLDVQPEATLGDVLNRAADAFGVTPAGPYVGRMPSDIVCAVAFPTSGGEPAYYVDFAKLPLIDASGRVFWMRFSEAPMEALVRSADSGVFSGDALRPYFMPQVAAGGAGPVEWASIYHGLQAIWQIAGNLGPLATAYGVATLVRDLAKRVTPARKVVSEHQVEWTSRGAGPPELLELIRSKPWKASDLAHLLGCSEDDVAAILWVAGMAYDEQLNMWMLSGSDSAKVSMLAMHCGMCTFDEQGAETELRTAFELYAATGEVPACPPSATSTEIDDDWDEELDDNAALPDDGAANR